MKTIAIFLAGALSMGIASMWAPRFRLGAVQQAAREQPARATEPVELAADGRIEGRSEATAVGPPMTGVLTAVHVREGQHVSAGAALAEVQCGDLRAESAAAVAAVEGLRQERVRLLRGSRAEERQIAAEQVTAAAADLKEAGTRLGRLHLLLEKDEIPRVQFDEAQRQFEAAQAHWRQAAARETLTKAGPLPEEVERIDQQIRGAVEHAASLDAAVEKCVVRAPISGTILRVQARAGEAVSTVFPRPLFTMADTSRLHVRAEVDEHDIGKVRIGQTVRISAPGLRREVGGTVRSISPMMGRRTVLSGDPAEKSDRDTLEVVADLEAAPALAVGLRVTVRFVR